MSEVHGGDTAAVRFPPAYESFGHPCSLEDAAVRKNRLLLLADLLREFTTVADFSEIGADERR